MFSLMANCFSWLKGYNKPDREIKLVIIGLDDAGKTTTVACLEGEPPDGITPTVGFANAKFRLGKWNITLFDLGGGANVRTVWKRYYAEVYGIIYAIDSGNPARLLESRNALAAVFEEDRVKGKPVVVFANKQDKEDALDENQIAKELDLQEHSDRLGFKFNVFPCSALKGYGKNMDKSIKEGLQWLLNAIAQDYAEIHKRVEHDSSIQKELEERERKERLEKIRQLREERELAAKVIGVDDDAESSDDDVVVGPFRNITDQIAVTERREKREKERRLKIEAYLSNKKSGVDEPPGNVVDSVDGVVDGWSPPQRKLDIPDITVQSASPTDSTRIAGTPVQVGKRSKKGSVKLVYQDENVALVESSQKNRGKDAKSPKPRNGRITEDAVNGHARRSCEDPVTGVGARKDNKARYRDSVGERGEDDLDDVDGSDRPRTFGMHDGRTPLNPGGVDVYYGTRVTARKGFSDCNMADFTSAKSGVNFKATGELSDDYEDLVEVGRFVSKKSPVRNGVTGVGLPSTKLSSGENETTDEGEDGVAKSRTVSDLRDSRVDLFRAKGSLESLGDAASGDDQTGQIQPAKYHKQGRKYANRALSDSKVNDAPNKRRKKKKKKKSNQTAPAPDGSVQDSERLGQLPAWTEARTGGLLPTRKGASLPKLESLRNGRRLPQLQAENGQNFPPPWVLGRPNSEEHDVMM